MHLAAIGGATHVMPELVAEGFDVDANENDKKITPLHCAATAGKTDAFRLLMHLGATASKKDYIGYSAYERAVMNQKEADLGRLVCGLPDTEEPELKLKLWFAAARGNNVRVLRELLMIDFPVNALTKKGCFNALHLAVIQKADVAVHLLLSAGIERDVSAGDDNNTALHDAVLSGSLAIIKLLCEAGVDLNKQNKDGKTALHLAFERRLTPLIDYLREAGADPTIADKDGVSVDKLAELSSPDVARSFRV